MYLVEKEVDLCCIAREGVMIIIIIISFMMYTHQRTDGNLYQQPIITNYNIS